MNLHELAPKAAQAEGFLKALANRHRLMILCELHKGEQSRHRASARGRFEPVFTVAASRPIARRRARKNATSISDDLLFPGQ